MIMAVVMMIMMMTRGLHTLDTLLYCPTQGRVSGCC